MIPNTLQQDLARYAGVRWARPIDGPLHRIAVCERDGKRELVRVPGPSVRLLRGQTPDELFLAELSAPLGAPLERVVITALLARELDWAVGRNTLALLMVLGLVFPAWPASERNAFLALGLRAVSNGGESTWTGQGAGGAALRVTLERQVYPLAVRLTIAPLAQDGGDHDG